MGSSCAPGRDVSESEHGVKWRQKMKNAAFLDNIVLGQQIKKLPGFQGSYYINKNIFMLLLE